eukprot:TRINITY_DN4704_c0_g1_i1.p1 TRINITY_DN4704_c0_g1~~TRINITY_DN4704_c0_g1_i1.p1  ORF type:complete len:155 (-),score=39.73 TRINITY_DN4704_c0_g1_i1:221-685(-)
MVHLGAKFFATVVLAGLSPATARLGQDGQRSSTMLFSENAPESGLHLTADQASHCMDVVLLALESKETGETIKAAISGIQAESGGDLEKMQSAMSSKMLPMLMEVVGGELKKYNIDSSNALAAFMQVQQLAASNPILQDKLSKITIRVQQMLAS